MGGREFALYIRSDIWKNEHAAFSFLGRQKLGEVSHSENLVRAGLPALDHLIAPDMWCG